MKYFLTATILFALIPPAFALDAACAPLIKASEAKLAQVAWHSVTESAGIKLEGMKVDGKFFMQIDGKWQKSPMDLDKAEKIAIAQMQEGGIKVTDCKDEGTETVDGVEMNVLSYTSEVPGAGLPGSPVKLYVGKEDGLPYKSATDDGKTSSSIRYKDVVAPKL